MAIQVFNHDRFTPLYYGDGQVIPALEWVEGEQSDFQALIDQNLVFLKENTASPAPIKVINKAIIGSSSDSESAKG